MRTRTRTRNTAIATRRHHSLYPTRRHDTKNNNTAQISQCVVEDGAADARVDAVCADERRRLKDTRWATTRRRKLDLDTTCHLVKCDEFVAPAHGLRLETIHKNATQALTRDLHVLAPFFSLFAHRMHVKRGAIVPKYGALLVKRIVRRGWGEIRKVQAQSPHSLAPLLHCQAVPLPPLIKARILLKKSHIIATTLQCQGQSAPTDTGAHYSYWIIHARDWRVPGRHQGDMWAICTGPIFFFRRFFRAPTFSSGRQDGGRVRWACPNGQLANGVRIHGSSSHGGNFPACESEKPARFAPRQSFEVSRRPGYAHCSHNVLM